MRDGGWYLESVAPDGSMRRHRLDPLPYTVGRDAANQLALEGMGLSRRHAQLDLDVSGLLRLTDLDSTNGTFVNHVPVAGSCLLKDNDVVHFGQAEFRLGRQTEIAVQPAAADDDERTKLMPAGSRRSEHFVPLQPQFLELLAGRGLTGAQQAIVDARSGRLVASELLGRSVHPQLPSSPIHLFGLAARLNREAELSRAFRTYGVTAVAAVDPKAQLFVNTHPAEIFGPALLEELAGYRTRWPELDLVVEVHETAVMEVSRMRELAARLTDHGIRFAYDDFGAGQARLNELGEVPADVVKFDMGLIRNLDQASERKRRVVQNLVHTVHDLDAIALAEGVETDAEAEVVRAMGFDLIQGYLTGRPVMLVTG